MRILLSTNRPQTNEPGLFMHFKAGTSRTSGNEYNKKYYHVMILCLQLGCKITVGLGRVKVQSCQLRASRMHPKRIANTSKTHPKGPKHNQNAIDSSHARTQKVSRNTDILRRPHPSSPNVEVPIVSCRLSLIRTQLETTASSAPARP